MVITEIITGGDRGGPGNFSNTCMRCMAKPRPSYGVCRHAPPRTLLKCFAI